MKTELKLTEQELSIIVNMLERAFSHDSLSGDADSNIPVVSLYKKARTKQTILIEKRVAELNK